MDNYVLLRPLQKVSLLRKRSFFCTMPAAQANPERHARKRQRAEADVNTFPNEVRKRWACGLSSLSGLNPIWKFSDFVVSGDLLSSIWFSLVEKSNIGDPILLFGLCGADI